MPAALLLAVVCACAGDDPRAAVSADTAEDTPGAATDCGVPAAGVQIEQGIGVLEVGAAVKILRERCRLVKNSVVTGIEGMPGRQLYIVILGDTVVAEVEQDTVWRIRLTTERLRTGDSLGVGSPAEDLTSREGARALVGEGEIFLYDRGSVRRELSIGWRELFERGQRAIARVRRQAGARHVDCRSRAPHPVYDRSRLKS